MRIISGKYRGKKLHPPKNLRARPTTDLAKESLFNILVHQLDLEELQVLDLFAGTGSISYEFASRGVREVVSVEKDPFHFRYIRQTCLEMEMEQVHVIQEDAFRYLQNPYQSFDLVFADPPYDHPRLGELPGLVLTSGVLEPDGVFILEHPAAISFRSHPLFFHHRKYGNVNFSMFGSDQTSLRV